MGEFEKRFNQMGIEHDPEAGDWITPEHVMEVIEEAKKEFPETCILEILKPIVSDEVLEKVKVELYKYPQGDEWGEQEDTHSNNSYCCIASQCWLS